MADDSGEPLRHPHIGNLFDRQNDGQYQIKQQLMH
ncbi:heat shock protein HspQ [Paenochrobactrum gallinarii]|uniref:Heat shock protein HspQ n=2 Tax=Paenochrobactrum gallinarii TaxID=643673 RepID=A0A841M1A7_9HYPH|nr:heat shock protein HspQ [Paenochrobactrum gallinarii]